MTTTSAPKLIDRSTAESITQAEYLEAEMGYLLRRLAEGNTADAATSARTLQNELHKILNTVDPTGQWLGRITTQNGRYYRWPFLDN